MRKSVCAVVIIFVLFFTAMFLFLIDTGMGFDAIPLREVLGALIFGALFCASVYGLYRLSQFVKKRVTVVWNENSLTIKFPKISLHKEN